jgi:hypothetical protein
VLSLALQRQTRNALFCFVDPESLVGRAQILGLKVRRRREIGAQRGKAFLALELCRERR